MLLKPIFPFEPVSRDIFPTGENWLAQIKWDGVRVLTYYDGQTVELYNRKLHERTSNYPELLKIKDYCQAASVILDGEVIALGSDGKPSFQQVMKRDSLRRLEKVTRASQEVPITYMVFDILYLNGEWLNHLPLSTRQERLQQVICPQDYVQMVTSHDDGPALFQVIKAYGLEGIVMKRKDAPYLIGEKRDYWCKIKNYKDVIAVVGGFTLKGDTVNALLLGLYDRDGKLCYIGHVGTGKLSQQDWRNLTPILQPLVRQSKPFNNGVEREREAVWVKPEITVKVQFAEWTPAYSLRQPSIQAFVDVPPAECVFEG